VRLQLIRHATLVLEIAGRRVLVDPMLAGAGAKPAIESTANQRPNPLVDLPMPATEVVAGVEAVLVTHIHDDHFDEAAAEALTGRMPVLCQPEDVGFFKSRVGRPTVIGVAGEHTWEGIRVVRTAGRHGRGAIGDLMAPVSGFVVAAPGEPVLYLAGDTVWCDEVRAALDEHQPAVVVVHAGEARFLEGDPITMSADDVVAVARHAAGARVVAVHMEAVNHCGLTRDGLAERIAAAGLADRVAIPADGDTLDLALTTS
jgi:L-ascorbate metabolism protein UlaG (beta-lactamase superfamily)